MTDSEKLSEAFGELVYTVAIADGYVQPEETERLKQLLRKHDWAEQIEWSFNYEVKAHNNVDHVYQKALDTFEQIGPRPEYRFMVDVLREVAHASNGTDASEERAIDNFEADLVERFTRDIEALKLKLVVD